MKIYKPRRNNEEQLRKAIKQSRNLIEVLNKLNLRGGGNNYGVLKKWIQYYNIDISHFETASERAKRVIKFAGDKARPLKDILVKNSIYNSSNLKTRLYKEDLKKPICELCGQDENWQGKKMSLILDHIDGNHTNNELKNLRIVCPNCNSTLDTHCSKNKIKKEKIKTKKEPDYIKREEKIKQILNLNIDYSKHGWRLELAKQAQLTPQYVGIFVKKYLPDIWNKAKKHNL